MRPFVPTLTAAVMTITGLFWATHAGVSQRVWETDTYWVITAIAVLFVVSAVGLIGAAYSHENGADPQTTVSRLRLNAYLAKTLPTLGFLGTVLGLIGLMDSSVGLTPEALSAAVADGTSTALYPTAVGLLAFFVLSFMMFCLSEAIRGGDR